MAKKLTYIERAAIRTQAQVFTGEKYEGHEFDDESGACIMWTIATPAALAAAQRQLENMTAGGMREAVRALPMFSESIPSPAEETNASDRWGEAYSCSATCVWAKFGGKGGGREEQLKKLKADEVIIDYRRKGRSFQVIVKPQDRESFSRHIEAWNAKDNRGGSRQNASKQVKSRRK